MKKIFIICIALSMCFLCSCGSTTEQSKTATEETPKLTPTPTKTPEQIEYEKYESKARIAAEIALIDLKGKVKNPHSLKVLEDVSVYITKQECALVSIDFSSANNVGGEIEADYSATVVNDKVDDWYMMNNNGDTYGSLFVYFYDHYNNELNIDMTDFDHVNTYGFHFSKNLFD